MTLNFSASPLKPRKELNTESASLTSPPNHRPTVIPQTSPKSTSHYKSLICEATDVRFLSLNLDERNRPRFMMKRFSVVN